jgi:hypothetical protein
VLAQLEWLTDFAEGRNDERHRLGDLGFGVHLAKEDMDTSDVELVAALNAAAWAADVYGRGLKIAVFVPADTASGQTREG